MDTRWSKEAPKKMDLTESSKGGVDGRPVKTTRPRTARNIEIPKKSKRLTAVATNTKRYQSRDRRLKSSRAAECHERHGFLTVLRNDGINGNQKALACSRQNCWIVILL